MLTDSRKYQTTRLQISEDRNLNTNFFFFFSISPLGFVVVCQFIPVCVCVLGALYGAPNTHTQTGMNWHTATKPNDFNDEVELTDTILVT